jgi:hypothetical protein
MISPGASALEGLRRNEGGAARNLQRDNTGGRDRRRYTYAPFSDVLDF